MAEGAIEWLRGSEGATEWLKALEGAVINCIETNFHVVMSIIDEF